MMMLSAWESGLSMINLKRAEHSNSAYLPCSQLISALEKSFATLVCEGLGAKELDYWH